MSIRRTAMVLLSASLTVTLSAPTVQAAQTPGGEDGLDAQHSLRAAVTDESFYFVMADRFENADTANDDGGLGSDPLVSGFDPTRRGSTTVGTSRDYSIESTTSRGSVRRRSG